MKVVVLITLLAVVAAHETGVPHEHETGNDIAALDEVCGVELNEVCGVEGKITACGCTCDCSGFLCGEASKAKSLCSEATSHGITNGEACSKAQGTLNSLAHGLAKLSSCTGTFSTGGGAETVDAVAQAKKQNQLGADGHGVFHEGEEKHTLGQDGHGQYTGEPKSCVAELKKLCGDCAKSKDKRTCLRSCVEKNKAALKKAGCTKPHHAAHGEAAAGTPLPGAGAGSIGPRWTWDADFEKPAGEKDMGGWTARVYTEEQQARLRVDELGAPAKLGADGHGVFEGGTRHFGNFGGQLGQDGKGQFHGGHKTLGADGHGQFNGGHTTLGADGHGQFNGGHTTLGADGKGQFNGGHKTLGADGHGQFHGGHKTLGADGHGQFNGGHTTLGADGHGQFNGGGHKTLGADGHGQFNGGHKTLGADGHGQFRGGPKACDAQADCPDGFVCEQPPAAPVGGASMAVVTAPSKLCRPLASAHPFYGGLAGALGAGRRLHGHGHGDRDGDEVLGHKEEHKKMVDVCPAAGPKWEKLSPTCRSALKAWAYPEPHDGCRFGKMLKRNKFLSAVFIVLAATFVTVLVIRCRRRRRFRALLRAAAEQEQAVVPVGTVVMDVVVGTTLVGGRRGTVSAKEYLADMAATVRGEAGPEDEFGGPVGIELADIPITYGEVVET